MPTADTRRVMLHPSKIQASFPKYNGSRSATVRQMFFSLQRNVIIKDMRCADASNHLQCCKEVRENTKQPLYSSLLTNNVLKNAFSLKL